MFVVTNTGTLSPAGSTLLCSACPALIADEADAVVEEVVRFDCPVSAISRVAAADPAIWSSSAFGCPQCRSLLVTRRGEGGIVYRCGYCKWDSEKEIALVEADASSLASATHALWRKEEEKGALEIASIAAYVCGESESSGDEGEKGMKVATLPQRIPLDPVSSIRCRTCLERGDPGVLYRPGPSALSGDSEAGLRRGIPRAPLGSALAARTRAAKSSLARSFLPIVSLEAFYPAKHEEEGFREWSSKNLGLHTTDIPPLTLRKRYTPGLGSTHLSKEHICEGSAILMIRNPENSPIQLSITRPPASPVTLSSLTTTTLGGGETIAIRAHDELLAHDQDVEEEDDDEGGDGGRVGGTRGGGEGEVSGGSAQGVKLLQRWQNLALVAVPVGPISEDTKPQLALRVTVLGAAPHTLATIVPKDAPLLASGDTSTNFTFTHLPENKFLCSYMTILH